MQYQKSKRKFHATVERFLNEFRDKLPKWFEWEEARSSSLEERRRKAD